MTPQVMREVAHALDRLQRRYGMSLLSTADDPLRSLQVGGVSGYLARRWAPVYTASRYVPIAASVRAAKRIRSVLSPRALRGEYAGLSGVLADAGIQRAMRSRAYGDDMLQAFGSAKSLENADLLDALNRTRRAQRL